MKVAIKSLFKRFAIFTQRMDSNVSNLKETLINNFQRLLIQTQLQSQLTLVQTHEELQF